MDLTDEHGDTTVVAQPLVDQPQPGQRPLAELLHALVDGACPS